MTCGPPPCDAFCLSRSSSTTPGPSSGSAPGSPPRRARHDSLRRVAQGIRADGRRRRPRLHDRAGTGVRLHRTQRRRQDDDHPDDDGAPRADRRQRAARRARHRPRAGGRQGDHRLPAGPSLPLRQAHRGRVPALRRRALRPRRRRARAPERRAARRVRPRRACRRASRPGSWRRLARVRFPGDHESRVGAGRRIMTGAPSLLWLLSPRLLAARGALRRGRTKPLLLAAMAGAFWVGCFLFFERTLAYFQTIAALGPVLTERLLVLLFASSFAVLALSNLVTALSTFYGAPEVSVLLAAPLGARRVHQVRFIETLAASSWMVLLFGLPAFVAYGIVHGAGPVFYLATVATLLPFLVIPAALGVLAATGIVLVFSAQRAREVLLVVSVTLAAGAYLAIRLLRPESLASPSGLAGFAAFLGDVGAPSCSPWSSSTSTTSPCSRSTTGVRSGPPCGSSRRS